MKKILLLIIVLILTACSFDNSKTEINHNEAYEDYLISINKNKNFKQSSDNFDISYEIAKIDGGYRYYIFIDNPKIAIYGINAIAIQEGVDYKRNMAPSLGLFESEPYHLIPNQTKKQDGYVKGLMLSGVSKVADPKIRLMVSYNIKNIQKRQVEYFEFVISINEVENDQG